MTYSAGLFPGTVPSRGRGCHTLDMEVVEKGNRRAFKGTEHLHGINGDDIGPKGVNGGKMADTIVAINHVRQAYCQETKTKK